MPVPRPRTRTYSSSSWTRPVLLSPQPLQLPAVVAAIRAETAKTPTLIICECRGAVSAVGGTVRIQRIIRRRNSNSDCQRWRRAARGPANSTNRKCDRSIVDPSRPERESDAYTDVERSSCAWEFDLSQNLRDKKKTILRHAFQHAHARRRSTASLVNCRQLATALASLVFKHTNAAARQVLALHQQSKRGGGCVGGRRTSAAGVPIPDARTQRERSSEGGRWWGWWMEGGWRCCRQRLPTMAATAME